nr:putative reverse transcriptase domain, ribonuclease H-like domain, aspartic peptidase domain protein [Tanacetum cinerariifolium]
MPPKAMSQAAIERLITQRVNAALEVKRASRANELVQGSNANETRGQDMAPLVRECTFLSVMKCNPTPFHGKEGVIELCWWFEKSKMVFSISDCAERNKVKFAAATLQGRALTWWNSQVATLGLDVAIKKSWSDMKKMMMEEFYPDEEVQRMEDELRSLKLRDTNIATYTQRFHELVLLCLEAVPTEKKKVEAYIKGLPEKIKGEVTSSRPVNLNEAVRMAHTLMEQNIQAKAERIAEGNKRKWENSQGGNRSNNNRGNYQDNTRHHQYNNQRHGNTPGHYARDCRKKAVATGEKARGRAYVIKEADKDQGPNVVMGTFLLNNRYATVLFDLSSDKSFVNTSFSHLIDIDPVRLDTSYEVELADGRVASTNIVLKGCTIYLVGHFFKIDLMPIDLGTFNVIIDMDWLVEQDAVIVCGKKLRKSQEKRLEDVPVIRDFPEVFPDDLPGFPPPRQVEFRIDLVPGAAPSKEEHEEHLKTILELLKREQLYAKFLKCDFRLESVQFLRHVIDSEGVHVDPMKIPAIKNWVTPTTPTEVRQFLGLAGYYRRFIKGFSFISKPLTKLTPKIKKFEWETEAEEAFQMSKQKLCCAPILALPEGSEDFVSAYFLPVKTMDSKEKLTQLYLKEIICRHGVPISIISDRDSKFTSRFWWSFKESLGTRLDMSIACHPKMDGQSERIIQTLKDMLRACVINFGGSWDRHLPLVEFSYNNSYHASIKAVPFEALYGWKCRSPVCWSEVGDSQLTGPKLIQETSEKIVQIKNRLLTARSRQKSYTDVRRRPLEFNVEDKVMFKVSPWKGMIRFRKRGKLSLRFIGPFKILETIGLVTYELELPRELQGIHNTFHVLNLNKCLSDESLIIPLDEVQLDDKLYFIEEPAEIMDREVKRLKQSHIPIVKEVIKNGATLPKTQVVEGVMTEMPITFAEEKAQRRLEVKARRDKNHIRTIGDYSKPSHEGYRNIIELPEGNNVVPLRSDSIRVVNKITSLCETYSGPHNTQYRMENPEQAFIEYVSSRTDKAGGINAFALSDRHPTYHETPFDQVKIDDPNITMEEYIRLEEEKAHRRDFEKEFSAIVYNDALTSKSDFLTKPTMSAQRIDEFNLKDESSLSKYDEEEQNVLYFNNLFPFNVIYPDELKSDADNDNDKIDIEQSSRNLFVKPLPDVIKLEGGAYAHGSNNLLETSHDTANKFFKTKTLIKELNVNIVACNYLIKWMLINLIKNLYLPFGISFDSKLFYNDGSKLGKV